MNAAAAAAAVVVVVAAAAAVIRIETESADFEQYRHPRGGSSQTGQR